MNSSLATTSLTARMPSTIPHPNHFRQTPSRIFFLGPSLSRSTAPRIVCMAEPYLIIKLESAEKTWKELSAKLGDPDVVSNPSEYQKLAQSVAELDDVVSIFKRFKDCEKMLEDTKALAKEDGNDEDMAEMIAYEIESLSSELKQLEEKCITAS
ncbi:hypothetical protein OIU78_015250 [Salix suchowensis]|nr:hypothetical protein OIU78_015250 [Salix suchowensis]